MKTKSDDLHALIHSLGKAEIRQFKRHSNRITGRKKYLEAFDYFWRLKQWNPEKVEKKFQAQNNVAFAVRKNYIYRAILDSLAWPYPDRLNDGIRSVEILLERGLPNLAARQITKVRKKAERSEQFALLNGIYALKWRILEIGGGRQPEKDALETEQARKSNLEKWHLHERLKVALESLERISRRHPVFSPAFQTGMGEAEELLGSGNWDAFGSARIAFAGCLLREALCRANGDFPAGAEYCREAIRILQSKPFLKTEHPGTFLKLHSCWVRGLLEQGKNSEALEILNRLDDHLASAVMRYPDLEATALVYGFYLCQNKRPEQITRLESYLEQPETALPTAKMICFHLATHYFANGQSRKALRFAEQYRSFEKSGRNQLTVLQCRILSILAWLDLGNYDLAGCELHNAKAYLRRLDAPFPHFSTVLNGLQALLNFAGTPEYKTQVRDFHSQIKGPDTGPGRLDYEVFLPETGILDWVQTKVKDISEIAEPVSVQGI